MISIIDDDASVREATQRFFRSLGYVAACLRVGRRILAIVPGKRQLLPDHRRKMPGMSGVELQRHLQIQGCQVPIIFITSFDDESIRTQALNAGAVCFLTKPFEIRTLIKHLEEALKRRPSAPTTAFRTAEQRK